MNNDILVTISTAAKQLGYSQKTMQSGAGHDAQEMAHIASRNDLYSKRRRHQPLAKGIFESFGHGQWRQCIIENDTDD